jgi:hypothetical protein
MALFDEFQNGLSSLLSPSGNLSPSNFANPSNNLSPTLTNSFNPSLKTGDILSPRTNVSLSDSQAGIINLRGALQVGDTTTKKAMLYAPNYIIGSQGSSISSSPSLSQQDGKKDGILDFLQQPTTLLVLGGIGIAAIMLTGKKK